MSLLIKDGITPAALGLWLSQVENNNDDGVVVHDVSQSPKPLNLEP